MQEVLLVVGLQPEFKGKRYKKILKYINEHKDEYDQIVGLHFIKGNSLHDELLDWNMETEELINLEFNYDRLIYKTGYGLSNYGMIPKNGRRYTIVGCETDACIMKIAMDMFDREYNFRVLEKYTYTNNKKKNAQKHAIDILKRNIGKVVE